MSVIQTVVSKVASWLRRNKIRREIVVNVEKLETRVAVLENGRLEEFMVEHPEDERLVGCVFKGRIQNLQDDLQAAFVDIGLKKNAFLHYWDMQPDFDAFLDEIDDVLGIFPEKEKDDGSFADVMGILVDLRKELRKRKQYDLADMIRDRLSEAGYAIEDSADGAKWKKI